MGQLAARRTVPVNAAQPHTGVWPARDDHVLEQLRVASDVDGALSVDASEPTLRIHGHSGRGGVASGSTIAFDAADAKVLKHGHVS